MTSLTPSNACLDTIKHYEGCKLKAYLCPAKVWTIGYGRTTNVKAGDTCTQDQADKWLADEVEHFAKGIAKIAGKCTQGQFDALVSFAYNCGLQALKTSTLLRMHKADDHAGAAAQFSRWNKGGGKVLAGLTRRRAAEAALYRS